MAHCDECDKDFVKPHHLAAHNRVKHPAEGSSSPLVNEPKLASKPQPTSPAQLKVLPQLGTQQAISPFNAGRTIKMFSPRCDVCQGGNAPTDWWKHCPHFPNREDMYFETSLVPFETLSYEPDEDDPTIQVVGSSKKKVQHVRTARMVQVPLMLTANSGKGVEMAKQDGCIFPQELGYAPFCQFRECWSTDIRIHSEQYGEYCSTLHAKLAAADAEGVILNAMDARARARQLNEISL